MVRELTGHKGGIVNDAISLKAMDDPDAGGACRMYYAAYQNSDNCGEVVAFKFQNGSPQTVGVNGITNEVLIAILIDRLEGFQSGPFACEENHEAIYSLNRAKDFLNFRTEKRNLAGIEGAHQKDNPMGPTDLDPAMLKGLLDEFFAFAESKTTKPLIKLIEREANVILDDLIVQYVASKVPSK